MSRRDHTDAVMEIVGEAIRIVRPCLRDEEIAEARNQLYDAISAVVERLVERLRRENQRLGRKGGES
jgi:hypothetical protein